MGTASIASTCPASREARRAGSRAMVRSVTRAQCCLPPQYASKRSTSSSSPVTNFTSLYGPVPTTALPELKSAVVAPFAAFACTMKMLAKSESSCGFGALVFTRMVWSSTFFTDSMPRVNWAKELGELGTLGTRSMVKITSSAVKGVPSWNFTFWRSLNSHVVSSTSFHEVASAGLTASLSSYSVSLSKKYCSEEFGAKEAKKCGSRVFSSSLLPSVRFWACADAARAKRSAGRNRLLIVRMSLSRSVANYAQAEDRGRRIHARIQRPLPARHPRGVRCQLHCRRRGDARRLGKRASALPRHDLRLR